MHQMMQTLPVYACQCSRCGNHFFSTNAADSNCCNAAQQPVSLVSEAAEKRIRTYEIALRTLANAGPAVTTRTIREIANKALREGAAGGPLPVPGSRQA